MARLLGVPNQGYEQKRIALITRLESRLVSRGQARASFREMAEVAGVSVPTLRHYFTNREGVIDAYLSLKSQLGEPHLANLKSTDEPFPTSIHSLVNTAIYGLSVAGVVELHIVGIVEGVSHTTLGPSYLRFILEPTLSATEERLALHVLRGEMLAVNVRTAALALISPIILAVLHQQDLGGDKLRCLDLPQFAKDHSEAFIRGYQSTTSVQQPVN